MVIEKPLHVGSGTDVKRCSLPKPLSSLRPMSRLAMLLEGANRAARLPDLPDPLLGELEDLPNATAHSQSSLQGEMPRKQWTALKMSRG